MRTGFLSRVLLTLYGIDLWLLAGACDMLYTFSTTHSPFLPDRFSSFVLRNDWHALRDARADARSAEDVQHGDLGYR